MRSATVTIFRPCSRATCSSAGRRAIVPSGFMISQITPAWRESCEAREVDSGLGVARALEHAAWLGAQRKDVPGHGDVFGSRPSIDGGEDRRGPVCGRDARRDLALGADRYVEGRSLRRGIELCHRRNAQRVEALPAHRQADEPAPVLGHEVHGVWRDLLGSHDEVAFVLAVFIVDHDEHSTGPDVVDGLLDSGEDGLVGLVGHVDHLPSAKSWSMSPRPRREPGSRESGSARWV